MTGEICHNDAIRRTTVMADEAVLERLRRAAADQGRSLADLIREALEEKAASLAPTPASLGHGDSRGHGPSAADIGDLPIESETLGLVVDTIARLVL